MILNTNTLVTNTSSHSVGTYRSIGTDSVSNKLIVLKGGVEVPLYTISSYTLPKRDMPLNFTLYNTLGSIYNNPRLSATGGTLGKRFYKIFADSYKLVKISTSEGEYNVAKGCILDNNFKPYILFTYECPLECPSGFTFILDQSKIKIYISRRVFTEEFKATNPKMSKIFRDKILPEVMTYEIPIFIKDEIRFQSNYTTKDSLSEEDYNKMLEESVEYGERFFRLLQ